MNSYWWPILKTESYAQKQSQKVVYCDSKKEQQNRNFLNIKIASLAASFVRKNQEMHTLSRK